MPNDRNNKQVKRAEHGKGISPISGTAPPEATKWQPGESGNPHGRPRAAGTTLREWCNILVHKAELELKAIIDDLDAPAAKRSAARMTMLSMSGDLSKGGVPLCVSAFQEICDQTAGKPVQSIELSAGDESAKTDLNFNFSAFASMFAITQPSNAVLSEPSGKVFIPSAGPAESQNRVGGNGHELSPAAPPETAEETAPNNGPEIEQSFAPVVWRGSAD